MIFKNKKELDTIKQFLISKPGYLKEGGKRLKAVLLLKGFNTTTEMCKQAIREVNEEFKTNRMTEVSNDNKSVSKVLIYDIETSYLITSSWRIGYNLNLNHEDIIEQKKIICVSYKWLGEDQVYTLTWDKNRDDRFLLEQFIEVMNEADMLVAHNGDKYDLRFIRTRAILQGLDMLIDYPQFDTLKVAKKKFSFDSNKLDNLGKDLNLGQKIRTDKKLWDDVILRQDPKALIQMVEYCEQDVLLLEKIYKRLVSWENPRLHEGILQGKLSYTSPITGKTNIELVKTISTGKGGIKHIMRDLDTNRLFEMSSCNYNKYLKEQES